MSREQAYRCGRTDHVPGQTDLPARVSSSNLPLQGKAILGNQPLPGPGANRDKVAKRLNRRLKSSAHGYLEARRGRFRNWPQGGRLRPDNAFPWSLREPPVRLDPSS
jgi:hypothetical protein